MGLGLEERGYCVDYEEDDEDVVEIEPPLLMLLLLAALALPGSAAAEGVGVDVAATLVVPVHGHPAEKCAEEIVELLEFIV